MAQMRESVVEEARRLGVDVLYSEKGHFMAARIWSALSYALNIPSAVLAAVASVAFFKGAHRESAGWLAVAAAALTAIATALNPADRAARHHRTGVIYAALRRQIRNFVQVEVRLNEGDKLVRSLNDLINRTSKLQAESPSIFQLAYIRARRSVGTGSANYTQAELDAATGELPSSNGE